MEFTITIGRFPLKSPLFQLCIIRVGEISISTHFESKLSLNSTSFESCIKVIDCWSKICQAFSESFFLSVAWH